MVPICSNRHCQIRSCNLPTEFFSHAFLLSADFLKKSSFSKKSFRNTFRLSNSLDPDQAQHFVSPGLGPNCLQRFAVDNFSRQRVNHIHAEPGCEFRILRLTFYGNTIREIIITL